MNEKYIPGSQPSMNLELPDGDANSLVSKSGKNWDNGYNFDEKINNGKTTFDNLADELGGFDPKQAEIERQKRTEELENNNVILSGEVSRMIENEEGNPKLESDYLDIYDYYLHNGDYDRENKEDRELGHSIWKIGRSAAFLDLDKNAREQLASSNNIDFEKTDPGSVYQYKKAVNEIITNLENGNQDSLDKVMDKISELGMVGESFLEIYEAYKELKENGRELPALYGLDGQLKFDDNLRGDKKEEILQSREEALFDTLENEYLELTAPGKGIDLDQLIDLQTRYSELAGTINNQEKLKKIEERQENLAWIADQLKGLGI